MAHIEGSPSDDDVEPAGDGRPRVLLVDDDPVIRQLVRLYLERAADFEIVGEADDGIEGIAQAEQLQPDVILLDVMMPAMSGYEALPKLQHVAPRTMVVMLSALGAQDQEETALAAGAFAYVEKTAMDLDLGEQLAELLDRFRQSLRAGATGAGEQPPQ